MAKRPPLTHFLCLPLLSRASRPAFERASTTFKEKLRNLPQPLDPEELGRAIRPLGTIHLTLGVMSLTNQERVEGAVKFLDDLDLKSLLTVDPVQDEAAVPKTGESDVSTRQQNAAKGSARQTNATTADSHDNASKHFTVTISSLKTMKSASKTSVLYAEPTDATGRLLPFSQQIKTQFTDAGYVNEEKRELKLHATILNTLYASNKSRKGPRKKKPMLIDATDIIQEFDDFTWAEDVVLEKIAICEMGAKKIEDENGSVVDEQYTEIASKPLPM